MKLIKHPGTAYCILPVGKQNEDIFFKNIVAVQRDKAEVTCEIEPA